MIHGRDLILSINGTPIAASTTCDLSIDTDFIEVCSPTGGAWKEYIPTQHGWDVSAGCLMANMEHFDQLLTMQKNKQRLELSFYDQGLQVFYKGDAYIKKLSTTGTLGNLAKMSVAFQACGELKATAKAVIRTNMFSNLPVKMVWGSDAVYIKDQTSSTDQCYFIGFTATSRTRLHLTGDCVVLNTDVATLSNTIDNYMGNDNFAAMTRYINRLAIAYAQPNEGKDIILKEGQPIVILRQENTDNLWYIQAN
jgi:hypothetical protein